MRVKRSAVTASAAAAPPPPAAPTARRLNPRRSAQKRFSDDWYLPSPFAHKRPRLDTLGSAYSSSSDSDPEPPLARPLPGTDSDISDFDETPFDRHVAERRTLLNNNNTKKASIFHSRTQGPRNPNSNVVRNPNPNSHVLRNPNSNVYHQNRIAYRPDEDGDGDSDSDSDTDSDSDSVLSFHPYSNNNLATRQSQNPKNTGSFNVGHSQIYRHREPPHNRHLHNRDAYLDGGQGYRHRQHQTNLCHRQNLEQYPNPKTGQMSHDRHRGNPEQYPNPKAGQMRHDRHRQAQINHRNGEYRFGDIVWAKSIKRQYRPWPAQIVNPALISSQLHSSAYSASSSSSSMSSGNNSIGIHERSYSNGDPSRFYIMFFGPSRGKTRDRDFAWVSCNELWSFSDSSSYGFLPAKMEDSSGNKTSLELHVAISEAKHAMLLNKFKGNGRVSSFHNHGSLLEQENGNYTYSEQDKLQYRQCRLPTSTSCSNSDQHNAREIVLASTKSVLTSKQMLKMSTSKPMVSKPMLTSKPIVPKQMSTSKPMSLSTLSNLTTTTNSALSNDKLPNSITVECFGVDGTYYPSKHEVICLCSSCKGRGGLMGINKWEAHTGCRHKKWKSSVKIKDSSQSLLSWLQSMADSGASGMAFQVYSQEHVIKARLNVPYSPVTVKWTPERCAVCQWIEDYDYNQMLVCNRCQIAVHEECYGVRASETGGSFLCRACEHPEKECCLCPVKGGALKPTVIPDLWVHVYCAWFTNGVFFQSIAKMEPATGLSDIPPEKFSQRCVVCEQVHGACVSCEQCDATYHPTCALRAGYRMEISSLAGQDVTRKISYCSKHRPPSKDARLILPSMEAETQKQAEPQPVNREMPENAGEDQTMLISQGSSVAAELDLGTGTGHEKQVSRCCEYRKIPNYVKAKLGIKQPIPHIPGGFSTHGLKEIESLRPLPEPGELLSIEERLLYLEKTQSMRICFGKSAIHNWGLFARRDIQEGEMVIEYRGEVVRRSMSDLLERKYQREGKDCYLFKVSEDVVIDATCKGNIARLINHSCAPNCFARIFPVKRPGGTCIILIAKRLVKAGEELTYDYLFDPDPDNGKVPCLCGASNCRKYIC